MKEVTKNIPKKPVKWVVTHPAGHVYVINDLDALISVHAKSQKILKAEGWTFQPIY